MRALVWIALVVMAAIAAAEDSTAHLRGVVVNNQPSSQEPAQPSLRVNAFAAVNSPSTPNNQQEKTKSVHLMALLAGGVACAVGVAAISKVAQRKQMSKKRSTLKHEYEDLSLM